MALILSIAVPQARAAGSSGLPANYCETWGTNYTVTPSQGPNTTFQTDILVPQAPHDGLCTGQSAAMILQRTDGGGSRGEAFLSYNNTTTPSEKAFGEYNWTATLIPMPGGGSRFVEDQGVIDFHNDTATLWNCGVSSVHWSNCHVISNIVTALDQIPQCTQTATFSSGGSGYAISLNECATQALITLLNGGAAFWTVFAAIFALVCAVQPETCAVSGVIAAILALVAAVLAFGAWLLGWIDSWGGNNGIYFAQQYVTCWWWICWGGGSWIGANPVPSGY